ncbi:MAG: DUF4350 domain-containing protein [Actinomycetaceae bacterium]|nr:DUF4350 domain-containing protein [Actinomycetaceae bacterium]
MNSSIPLAHYPAAPLKPRVTFPRVMLGLGLVALLISAVFIAFLTTSKTSRPFALDNPKPDGMMALAQVLNKRGVEIRELHSNRDLRPATNQTIVIVNASALNDEQMTEILSTGSNIVVLDGYKTYSLQDLVKPAYGIVDEGGKVECHNPIALRAKSVGSFRGSVVPSFGAKGEGCFASPSSNDEDGYGFVSVQHRDASIHVLASPEILTNENADQLGNAALGLGIMGKYPQLRWVYGTEYAQASNESPSIYFPQLMWLLILSTVSVLLFAAAKGRRFGRVVAEQMPVVIHAAESVRGRGRLYTKARSFEQATRALRHAARTQLSARLGLPPGAPDYVFTNALAQHTGAQERYLQDLFFGPSPTTERALHALTSNLDNIQHSSIRR